MDGKTLESKRRAEQYRLYIKFALADVDDLDILEEVYRTVYRLEWNLRSDSMVIRRSGNYDGQDREHISRRIYKIC